MRSAGCVINDYADRHLDRHVERTKSALTSGKVREIEALGLFAALCTLAFALVCLTNQETLYLVRGLFLAALYPFMKRYTYLPLKSFFLGAAFAWAIPMAYMAQNRLGRVDCLAALHGNGGMDGCLRHDLCDGRPRMILNWHQIHRHPVWHGRQGHHCPYCKR